MKNNSYDLASKKLFKNEITLKMKIISNHLLEDIPSSALPDTFSIDYYFVSYSHKDYKEVYYDIFQFQYHDLNIWYDRGIPAGKDWKEVAQRNITPFECKGVILYISENSLTSKAVLDEIKYVQEIGKQFVCITLPFNSDYLYKGESVKGKYFSILEMIEILKANKAINESAARELKKLFNKETIFLPYKTPSETKVEKIHLFTPTVPLLDGRIEEFMEDEGEHLLYITSIRDHMVNKITKQDFYDLINKLEGDLSYYYLIIFDKTSLANCYYLEKIELGKNMEVSIIGEYAFANDSKFIGFNTKETIRCSVGAGGFYNCTSLSNDFFLVYEPVGADAFSGCESVKHIELTSMNDFIGRHAFRNCKKLQSIEIPEEVKEIGAGAFSGCESLKEITLPNNLKAIKDATFSGCLSLEKVTMGDNIETVDATAFRSCHALKTIVLSDKCQFVGRLAFQHCDNLEFNVYENINYLGTKTNPYFLAFSLHDRLKKVTTLHQDCVVINSRIFNHCSHIVGSFSLPNKVTLINDRAFNGCGSLKEIILPDSLSIIEDSAFNGCRQLAKVRLGKNITKIGTDAFGGCPLLKEIVFNGSKEEWKALLKETGYSFKGVTIHCFDGDIKN